MVKTISYLFGNPQSGAAGRQPQLKVKTISFSILTILLLMAGTAFAAPTQQTENLLQNPGFEGGFGSWNNIPEAQVAYGWIPWWSENPNHNPAWHRPEWKPTNATFYSNRVHSGEYSQQWFTFFASHNAGILQQVQNVTSGQTYQFSLWVQVWSSIADNALQSVAPANPRLHIGIDPTGNTNPNAGTIIWSNEGSMNSIIDQYGYMMVEATAQSSTITVFVRTNPDFANKHNDIYIDDAAFVSVGVQPNPTPPPPPANTPPSTATPPPAPPPAIGNPVSYIVSTGDTLAAIGRRFGVSTAAIIQANQIANPNLIYIGQVLLIPGVGNAPPPPAPSATPPPNPTPIGESGGSVTYVIQSGDTLYRIALRFGVTVPAITQVNGISNPDFIYVGQVLKIP